MSTLEELGNQSYQKAILNDFKGAISILDKAIMKYPQDWRLYNNRSYCYYRIKDYKSALSDAEFMITEFPKDSKGYYRKAEVLIELKKFKEAELVLQELLKINPKCQEASFLLSEVQITQVRSGGKYLLNEAVTALQLTNYNTEQAKAFLEADGLKGANSYTKDDVYYSDEEHEEPSTSGSGITAKASSSSITKDNTDYDPYTDPHNPFHSNSVWVGNVTKKITEEMLKPIFSKYGKIKSIIVQHQNFCAFVNFMDFGMATNAMKRFPQHLPIADTALIIRYPDNAKTAHMLLGCKKNGIKIK